MCCPIPLLSARGGLGHRRTAERQPAWSSRLNSFPRCACFRLVGLTVATLAALCVAATLAGRARSGAGGFQLPGWRRGLRAGHNLKLEWEHPLAVSQPVSLLRIAEQVGWCAGGSASLLSADGEAKLIAGDVISGDFGVPRRTLRVCDRRPFLQSALRRGCGGSGLDAKGLEWIALRTAGTLPQGPPRYQRR